MTDLQKGLIAAALLASTMYLAGVFVAGLVLRVDLAWKLSLISMGVSFISYLSAYWSGAIPRLGPVSLGCAAVSNAAGVGAGLVLLAA